MKLGSNEAGSQEYENILKDKMLCQYLKILKLCDTDIKSDLAEELEILMETAKSYGKDIGYINGFNYGSQLCKISRKGYK